MIDENVAPTPRSGVDFSSLSPSPTPEQYFLLSRLDGSLTVGELCKISGIGRKKTLDALESLARSGAIELPGFEAPERADELSASSDVAETAQARPSAKQGQQAQQAQRGQTNRSATSPSKKSGGSTKKTTPNYPTPIEAFDFDQDLLDLDVPLGDKHRRELLCLHDQLDKMTFYDIFGVQEDASKKDIKKAYFRMSKRYHPDKYFRQEMGAIGPMLETVFKEITKAYRTLSSKRKREAYDAELTAQSAHVRESNPGDAATTRSSRAAAGDADSHVAEQNKRKAAAVLLMRRAEKLQKKGQFAQAAAEYRKALALNRDAELAVRVSRMLLDEANLADEASSFARAALKLGADEASSRYMLGRAKEALGAKDVAIAEYRKVLLASPGHAGATARLEEMGVQF